jgi:glycosyltransferase involved in cell wall biosynthesis
MTHLHVLAPARFGGLERVVLSLAGGMARRGHDVHAAAVVDAAEADGHPFLAALADAGVTVHRIEVGARAYGAERAAVARLRERIRPIVVHTHGYRADVLHGRASRGPGTIAISTVHGFTGGGRRMKAFEWMQRIALRGVDTVAAVSRPLARALAASGISPSRIRVIPNAVEMFAPVLGRADARRRLGISGDAFTVGWVGRLSREKGADVLLEALARIDHDLRCVVVGDGPERGALEAQAAALGLSARVRFAGAMDDAAALMPAFDAFALSSRTEGSPVALLEAVAAGIPLAAAAVGGVPDLLRPSEALLVPPEDPAALAAALRSLHADRASSAARAASARERVARELSVDAWLDAYEAAYAGRPHLTPSPVTR